MRKKWRSILLAFVLTLTLLPLAAPARADVRYVDDQAAGMTRIYWSGDVYGDSCAGWNNNGILAPSRAGSTAEVVLEGDTNLIIPEGSTVTMRICGINLKQYTLTITGGGTLNGSGDDGIILGDLVISGSTLICGGGVEVDSLTVVNGGVADVSGPVYPLIITDGGLTVDDGSVTAIGAEGFGYGCGILLENCDMTVNDGGSVTAGGERGGIISENGVRTLFLNGGAVEASSYESVTAAAAPGLTYAINGEGSYTGALSAAQLAAAAGKQLTCPAAQIGAARYDLLQEAFDAAHPGDTVRLLRDVRQRTGTTLNVNASLTLDLNGHGIAEQASPGGAIIELSSGVTLTLAGDGRIMSAAEETGRPFGAMIRGAGAAVSGVIFAGGAVSLGGPTTDSQFDGSSVFYNCGVTVNGGSLSVRAESIMIDSCSLTLNGGSLSARTKFYTVDNSSLTVNDGAVLDIYAMWQGTQCMAESELTVNGGAVLLRGGIVLHKSVAVVNGGTLELRGNGGTEIDGCLQGQITLNGGAVKLSELDDLDSEKLLVFGEGCTYAVQGMTGSYSGVTLTGLAGIAPLRGKWIAPAGAVCASGDLGSGISCVRYGDAVAVFGLPADARLFAAWYGPEGGMLDIAPRSGGVDSWGCSTAIGTNAARVKLLILDAVTCAPLCAPWDSRETA